MKQTVSKCHFSIVVTRGVGGGELSDILRQSLTQVGVASTGTRTKIILNVLENQISHSLL